YRPSNSADWAMISSLQHQELESNPQAMEDLKGNLKAQTDLVNLQVEPEIEFMMWWREQAAKNSKYHTLTPETAAQDCPLVNDQDPQLAEGWLDALAKYGFA